MKCLQFSFSHPVKGTACLTRISLQGVQDRRRLKFDTGENTELSLPIDDLPEGKWKLLLEWEYEERSFSHSSEFDRVPENTLFPAPMFANASLFHSKGTPFSTRGKYAAADSE